MQNKMTNLGPSMGTVVAGSFLIATPTSVFVLNRAVCALFLAQRIPTTQPGARRDDEAAVVEAQGLSVR